MHGEAVVPAALVLSHVEQLVRLRRYCPPAARVATVAGDPCLDRMVASQHLRGAYRTAFGLAAGQRLVVVSSTWGDRSLLGQQPALLRRLAAELPMDRYAVVAAIHPNVWHAHSPWQINTWLADCRRSGVVVVPPVEGWRAALLAADVVVGDHGSVTFYAAALGRPIVLAAADPDGLDPASPVARLTAVAPNLSGERPLIRQLDEAIAEHTADRYADIVEQATSAPGLSVGRLRTLLYGYLRLAEPDTPAVTTVIPIPASDTVRPARVSAVIAQTEIPGGIATATTVRLTRLPAELRLAAPPPGDSHLLVEWTHRDPRLLHVADVILARACELSTPALDWARQTLRAFPGSLAAAVDRAGDGCLLLPRNGPAVMLTAHQDRSPDAAVLVSAAIGWLTAGHSLLDAGSLVATVGSADHRLTVTPTD